MKKSAISLLLTAVLVGCAYHQVNHQAAKLEAQADQLPKHHQIHKVVVDDVEREFLLFTNPKLKSTQSVKLVVVSHGFMSSHRDFQQMTGFSEAAAKRDNIIVAYPLGLMAKPPWAEHAGTQWDIHWGTNTNDVQFYLSMITKLGKQFNLAEQGVYFTGHSNGGFMSAMMACEVSDKAPVAAIATVGGNLPMSVKARCKSKDTFGVLQISGLQDHIVPSGGWPGELLSIEQGSEFFAERFDCELTPKTQQLAASDGAPSNDLTQVSYPNCKANTAVEHILINNMGHTWPGSAIDLYTIDPNVGPTSYELNANEVILDFFQRF